jgi:hypothetical protein
MALKKSGCFVRGSGHKAILYACLRYFDQETPEEPENSAKKSFRNSGFSLGIIVPRVQIPPPA